ncbi:SURF1 family protein [Pseudoalteromonas sp. SSDWG2]|uniref:SURF1 family protein n=1 Tax=Pseudoalteromonas sp. SSDWG2 TaxID=3139391 RepID=UPI003BAAA2A6
MFTGKLSAILWSGLVILAVTVCTSLGFWQLERADQKQQRQQMLDAWSERGVLSFADAMRFVQQGDATGLQVRLSGEVHPQYWLLDNQVYEGKVGYDVIALILPQGSSHWLVTNLGFVRAPTLRTELPNVTLPSTITLPQALIKQGELGSITLDNDIIDPLAASGWPKRIQQIDITAMVEQTRKPIHAFMAYAQKPNDVVAAIPHYQPVTMTAQKHHAYALQWFLIAFAAVVIALSAYWRARRTHEE